MEVVGESLKNMDVSLYHSFSEGEEMTLNEMRGKEWRRNLGAWPFKSLAKLLKVSNVCCGCNFYGKLMTQNKIFCQYSVIIVEIVHTKRAEMEQMMEMQPKGIYKL